MPKRIKLTPSNEFDNETIPMFPEMEKQALQQETKPNTETFDPKKTKDAIKYTNERLKITQNEIDELVKNSNVHIANGGEGLYNMIIATENNVADCIGNLLWPITRQYAENITTLLIGHKRISIDYIYSYLRTLNDIKEFLKGIARRELAILNAKEFDNKIVKQVCYDLSDKSKTIQDIKPTTFYTPTRTTRNRKPDVLRPETLTKEDYAPFIDKDKAKEIDIVL